MNAKQKTIFSLPESANTINQIIYGLALSGVINLSLTLILHKKLWSHSVSKADYYFFLTIGFLIPLLITFFINKSSKKGLCILLPQDFPGGISTYLPLAAQSGNSEIIRYAKRVWWTTMSFAYIGGFCLGWAISLFVYFM